MAGTDTIRLFPSALSALALLSLLHYFLKLEIRALSRVSAPLKRGYSISLQCRKSFDKATTLSMYQDETLMPTPVNPASPSFSLPFQQEILCPEKLPQPVFFSLPHFSTLFPLVTFSLLTSKSFSAPGVPSLSHGCGCCWQHCQLSWGPRGNRGRGGMFDLELQLCFSMGNLHLFHLHSELPEEEGK